MRNSVCALVTTEKTVDADGFDIYAETRHSAFCDVRSVGRTEYYKAMHEGINVSMVIILDDDDYEDCGKPKLIEYNGTRYKVVRVYKNIGTDIELTVQEVE